MKSSVCQQPKILKTLQRWGTLGVLAAAVSVAYGGQRTGPSSSEGPYAQASKDRTRIVSLLTAGDSVGAAKMAGAPAGLAAMDNLDGTFSVFVSHHFDATQGLVRRHGASGSFISEWVYRKATLEAISGHDLVGQVLTLAGTQWSAEPASPFQRLAGLDLADPTAYFHAASSKGSQARLLLAGEATLNGRAMAHIASGSGKGNSHVLPWADRSTEPNQQVVWRQLRANPGSGQRTLVMAHLGGSQSGLLLYVGDKSTVGNDVERAGLIGGQVYRVEVPDRALEQRRVDAGLGLVANSAPVRLVGGTGQPLQDRVSGGTRWLDPRDGNWDPLNPRRYYFVTSDRMDAAKDGGQNADTPADQVGRSRLWRLTLNDLSRPELGGTLELLQAGRSGSIGYQMLASVLLGRDGSLTLAEDPGTNARPAQMWHSRYLAGDDRFERLLPAALADTLLFGDLSTPGTRHRGESFTNLIDADSIFGLPGGNKYCLVTAMRDRTAQADPAVVEGGQQMLMCLR